MLISNARLQATGCKAVSTADAVGLADPGRTPNRHRQLIIMERPAGRASSAPSPALTAEVAHAEDVDNRDRLLLLS